LTVVVAIFRRRCRMDSRPAAERCLEAYLNPLRCPAGTAEVAFCLFTSQQSLSRTHYPHRL